MKILIASGIYPPDVGGPAQYARNLYETWKKAGHEVKVAAYRWERAFPPGIRHILYFLKIIRKGWNADLVLVLDTWSAAVPTMMACRLMGKEYIVRTGGDYLWESYTERTGEMILFRNFYEDKNIKLSRKERLIFKLCGKVLRRAKVVVFSTEWQRDITIPVYGLSRDKCYIIENFCAPKMETMMGELDKTFVAWTRPLKWKNIDLLKEAFSEAKRRICEKGGGNFDLYTSKIMYENSLEKMHRSWAVVLVSIGDISPNMIYDALSTGTPFIVTKELGIAERVKEAAIFVDPLDKRAIVEALVWMADPANRAAQAEKVRKISFTHSWSDIAREIIAVAAKAGLKLPLENEQ